MLILIISFGLVFSGFSQPTPFSCDLITLSQETMRKDPSIKRQLLLNQRMEADRQLARSVFDYQLSAGLNTSRSNLNLYRADPRNAIVGPQIKTNYLGLNGGIQRTFRSGLRANFNLDYTRNSDNYPFDAYGESVAPFWSDNNTVTSFSLTYPLLRGKGRAIATANERMADFNIASQKENAAFNTNTAIYTTLVRYWQYLAAYQQLGIYQDNENRVRKVLEMTEELIKAEKQPQGDLLQIQADLRDKEKQTFLAEQQLYTSQQNLGLAIGWTQEESQQIGLPSSSFPDLTVLETEVPLETLVQLARQNRSDVKALEKGIAFSSVSIDLAENNIKPQLDVTAFATYGGSVMGNGIDRFFTALTQEEGRNRQIGIGLNYIFPIQNNNAQATLQSSELQLADQEIQLQNQIRNIEINVGIAYRDVLNSVRAVEKSKESLDYYQQVYENEQYKFKTGLTTLLNLILFQERLTFAQLDYVQNLQQLAIAIGTLRFETGTLIPTEQAPGTIASFDLNVYYTLPGVK